LTTVTCAFELWLFAGVAAVLALGRISTSIAAQRAAPKSN
jgi:hypothetical protein